MAHDSAHDKNETFRSDEVHNVIQRIRERNGLLKQMGFDFEAAVTGILKAALPLPQPILEIATGKGRFLTQLAQHANHIITVDMDPSEQRIAKILIHAHGLADRIQFWTADATALPFEDEFFASVVSMNTFHHLTDPQAVLKEMARVVRRNGKVVIADFNEDGYAAMERLHAAERRTHPRSILSTKDIATFWRNLGWGVHRAEAPCQEIVIAYGPQCNVLVGSKIINPSP